MNDFLALFEEVHDHPKTLMSLTRAALMSQRWSCALAEGSSQRSAQRLTRGIEK
jgi:hypothetical protein